MPLTLYKNACLMFMAQIRYHQVVIQNGHVTGVTLHFLGKKQAARGKISKVKDFTKSLPHAAILLNQTEWLPNCRKSNIRAKVEHAFNFIKHLFGFVKTSYLGLLATAQRLFVT